MALFKGSLAGPGYVILNVIRAMNIVSLLAVVAASSVMLVKTLIASNFFFFDGVTHVITALISLFLIVSELNVFAGYFNRNWPLLGQNSGFVTLGLAMVALGVWALGSLNKEAASQESLGLAFWRVVIAAGIISLVMGVANIVVHFIFSDSSLGVTARHVRARGAITAQDASSRSSTSSGHKSFQLGRKDSLPTYQSRSSSTKSSKTTMSMRQSPVPRLPLKISSPINNNQDQFSKFPRTPDINVPNLAHHPAMYSDRV